MPVFTALRNKAQSTASGFLTKTAQSALGLNRAKGLRFNQPNTGPVTGNAQTTRGGEVLQYPLDLGTDGNSHFIAFFVKQIEPAKAEIASPEGDKEEKKQKEAESNTLSKGTENKDKTAEQKQMNKKIDSANSKAFGTGKKIFINTRENKTHIKISKNYRFIFSSICATNIQLVLQRTGNI